MPLSQEEKQARISNAEQQIKKIVAEHAGRRAEEIRNDFNMSSDLHFDELDMIEVVFSIEDELDILWGKQQVDERDVQTVQQLIDISVSLMQ